MAYRTSPNELTVLQALVQSRQVLLNDALPLFWTSSRSKLAPQAPLQPPHTLSHLTTSTVSIGPHSFSETKLFVADWTEGNTRRRKVVAVAPPPPPPPASPGKMTPSLITRLNADSAKDPQLATILRKAATGTATPQELAHLAKHIKAVEKEDAELSGSANAAASTSQQWEEVDEPPAPPSLILEFRESSTKQFTVPSHYAYTELPPNDPTAKATLSDVLLSFFVFPSASGKGKEREGYFADGAVPAPIDLVVKDCSEEVKDALLRCSRTGRGRDLAVEDWWKRMILSIAPRIHIIDPTPAPALPELAPASSIPMLSRTVSFNNVDALNANGKRPALDSGSATPTSRPKAKKKAPARRSNARAKSTTAEVTPAPSSTGASPKPEMASRSRSNARPARKSRARSSKAALEPDSHGGLEGSEGVDSESVV